MQSMLKLIHVAATLLPVVLTVNHVNAGATSTMTQTMTAGEELLSHLD
jgi:hypothetical protein